MIVGGGRFLGVGEVEIYQAFKRSFLPDDQTGGAQLGAHGLHDPLALRMGRGDREHFLPLEHAGDVITRQQGVAFVFARNLAPRAESSQTAAAAVHVARRESLDDLAILRAMLPTDDAQFRRLEARVFFEHAKGIAALNRGVLSHVAREHHPAAEPVREIEHPAHRGH